MYRCIEVAAEDRDMQRILRRESSKEIIRSYRLKTLTYGTSPAPFLATRCLKQLALDIQEKFPGAAVAISQESYMDDWLSGGHSLEQALEKQRVVHAVSSKTSFHLVKYSSNSPKFLQMLDNKLVD